MILAAIATALAFGNVVLATVKGQTTRRERKVASAAEKMIKAASDKADKKLQEAYGSLAEKGEKNKDQIIGAVKDSSKETNNKIDGVQNTLGDVQNTLGALTKDRKELLDDKKAAEEAEKRAKAKAMRSVRKATKAEKDKEEAERKEAEARRAEEEAKRAKKEAEDAALIIKGRADDKNNFALRLLEIAADENLSPEEKEAKITALGLEGKEGGILSPLPKEDAEKKAGLSKVEHNARVNKGIDDTKARKLKAKDIKKNPKSTF